MMESAGSGQPGVSSPSGGGICVIDKVSCRQDFYAPENSQVTTERDRPNAERVRKCGKDIF